MLWTQRLWFFPFLGIGFLFSLSAFVGAEPELPSWQQRCAGIRTSYNPHADLRSDALTLGPHDSRWKPFLAWIEKNQIGTFEIVGFSPGDATELDAGIIFRWAAGTLWEQAVVIPFGQALAHLTIERDWRDLTFPEFFEAQGGVYDIDLAEALYRLDPHSLTLWQEFFQTIVFPASSYAPLLQARLSGIVPDGQSVSVTLGPDRVVDYSADRLRLDLTTFLTDCSLYEFFQAYDRQDSEAASITNPPPAGERGAAVSPLRDGNSSEALGQMIYNRECSACHGVTGNGQGLLASTRQSRPRDFTRALFRYRSTATGKLPTDRDLLRTVARGLPGSKMPAFQPFLSEPEQQAVVAYIKTFSARFANGTSPDPLLTPSVPEMTAERVARGAELYRDSGCGSCHGETGKGDGRSGQALKTAEGDPIAPRNLTDKWRFRGGHTPKAVFQRLMTGMDGSSMASYQDALEPDELWDLVFYVLSLSPSERPQAQAAQ